MKIIVVNSGSKGNATLIISKGRVLLIDMGNCYTPLVETLEKENLNLMNIEGMLLTHEHCDHTSGIKYLGQLPIYCTKETYQADNVNEVNPYEEFSFGDFCILPVSTSHDVSNPLGFVLKIENKKIVYITDTGKIPTKTQAKLKNADYYIIESNHDVEMLMNTNRPDFLKKRILSNKGHLSNFQSATYMTKFVGKNTKEIILAHLSEEANCPEIALKTYKKVFKEANKSLDGIELKCANQHYAIYGGDYEL